MIRMKTLGIPNMICVNETAASPQPRNAPIEEFINLIGFENIKQILTSSPNVVGITYYTIFYEDGQPFIPRAESDVPKKKGLFG